jgi:multidrug efflux pump subunit AcrA (membrane-fusion protein)
LSKRPGKPGAGLLLLAIGVGIGWSVHALLPPSADDADETPEEVAQAEMRVSVTTAPVTRGELPIVVRAAGVVRAAPAADHVLSSRAGGRVLETLVVPGQVVAAGDVLLRLDPLPLQAALAQARAAFVGADAALLDFDRSGRDRRAFELQSDAQRAASQVTLLQAQLERVQALAADGLSSDKAVAEAAQAVTQAQADQALAERAAQDFTGTSAALQHDGLVAQRSGAEAGVQEAERVLAEAELRAPCAGQLVEFLARPGQKLEPGDRVGRLLAPEGRLIAFGVAAADTGGLQPGARATWDDAQGAHGTGALQRLEGVVDPATGLIEAVVAPDAASAGEPPGLAVSGELQLRVLHDAVLVPEAAVLREHDAQVVVLADAGHARVVPVTVQGRHAGLAAVAGEVLDGQRVIVAGGYNLPDGAGITEAPPATGSAPPR